MLDMGFRPAVDRIVEPDARGTARRCSSRHARRRGGQDRLAYTSDARRHEHTPPSQQRGRRRAPLRGRDPRGQAGRPRRASCGEASRGRTLVFVRTKRGADRLVKRLQGARHRGAGHARQQDPVPARAGAGPVRAPATSTRWWPPTSPPAAWTSTTSPTSSTSTPRRTATATCTASAARAAPGAPASGITFVMRRAGPRDRPDGRRPVARRPVRRLGDQDRAARRRPAAARQAGPARWPRRRSRARQGRRRRQRQQDGPLRAPRPRPQPHGPGALEHVAGGSPSGSAQAGGPVARDGRPCAQPDTGRTALDIMTSVVPYVVLLVAMYELIGVVGLAVARPVTARRGLPAAHALPLPRLHARRPVPHQAG